MIPVAAAAGTAARAGVAARAAGAARGGAAAAEGAALDGAFGTLNPGQFLGGGAVQGDNIGIDAVVGNVVNTLTAMP